MKKPAFSPFLLCAVLLILVGFALPWTASLWQDKDPADQVQKYETAPVNLQSDASLLSHLQLVASGYSVVDLIHRPSTALTAPQCRTLAFDGLQALADQGLTLFDPEGCPPARSICRTAIF